ncbi:MAG TPA: sigma-54 dependent transcriptional regulator [Polyangiaceae bacterium]|jgi:DNA-binding NtrC family response regulator|nr:sigma-54 dependent transcriptional regulator [Polyangiaceae bacterium]
MLLQSPHALDVIEQRANDDHAPVSILRPSRSSGAPRVLRTLATESAAMRGVLTSLGRLGPTDVTVTLVGETGTGKDVLAGFLHEQSARAHSPFVVFDCGSVAQNLAESELFGHERGAFTGALGAHLGAFERAGGGTVFLDEIGELPLELQPRLLRVLENRTVRRVGGANDRRVDVRVVAATNRSLEAEVAAGRFRRDLYFRLAGAVVEVPPLRNRREDIPTLARALLADLGHRDVTFSADALDALARHPWPGNVRELKNTLGCAVAFLDGQLIEARHLRLPESRSDEPGLEAMSLGGLPLQDLEREAIRQTMARVGGNKSQAARALGIAVSTLYDKLKRHRL